MQTLLFDAEGAGTDAGNAKGTVTMTPKDYEDFFRTTLAFMVNTQNEEGGDVH